MNLVINFIGFQFGWFAAVLGGSNGYAWVGTVAALAIVAVHLFRVPQPHKEFLLILLTALIGFIWDSALVRAGMTVYPSGELISQSAPYWIVAMWMLFATTLNISLRWLRGRWWLAALTGAVFGPMAFYAGSQLGGVFFPKLPEAMMIMAVGWALFMPLLTALATRLDGTKGVKVEEMRYV
jgi:hypothetical protein